MQGKKGSKKPRMNRGSSEAQTGFEPVHQGVADPRLTTWLLRLAFYLIICYIDFKNDSNGNRTRVTAVKGRCLNRLTMEPYAFPALKLTADYQATDQPDNPTTLYYHNWSYLAREILNFFR